MAEDLKRDQNYRTVIAGVSNDASLEITMLRTDPITKELLVKLPAGSSGLTDAELRATAVPISGTVTANIGTVGTLATAAKQDTGNTSLSSIDGKIPALGQALAVASTPVVLTAAQITTLTPPVAITGFATSAKQDTLLTELQLKADLTETQPVSLAANQSVNIAQINGVTPLMGTGIMGTGSHRVTIASNNDPLAVTGTFFQATQPVSGTFFQATQPVSFTGSTDVATQTTLASALTALQLIDNAISGAGFNTTQLGGVNIAMNTGARSTGTQRVTIATDDLVPVTGTITAVTAITNNVNTVEVAPTTVAHALVTVTTAGTRVQFATNTAKSVTVKATAANTGIIYVGGSTVSSANGFPLAAGDTVSLDISNTNVVWIDSSVNAQTASWISNN